MKRRIVITGGGSGIGLRIAERFVQKGDKVAICDIDGSKINKINQSNLNILGVTADVSNGDDMENFKNIVSKQLGEIDVMISNAGLAGIAGPLEKQPFPEWKKCLSVNLDGAFFACQWAAKIMKRRKSGLILLMSSTSGLFGVPNRIPYVTAKWGLIGLTKSLAMELGPSGVRVNAICPGAVEGDRINHVLEIESKLSGETPLQIAEKFSEGVSLRRFVTANDIADMALFLASDEAKQISGQALAVDGSTERMV